MVATQPVDISNHTGTPIEKGRSVPLTPAPQFSESHIRSDSHSVINPPVLCASPECRGCFGTPSPRLDWVPLIAASARGCTIEVSSLVLQKSKTEANQNTTVVDVNAVDDHGRTALWHACDKGHETVVKVLCSHPEIQANILDARGWSALCVAAQRDYAGCVEALIASGQANVNIVGARGGGTAVIVACREGAIGTLKVLTRCPNIDLFAADAEARTGVWHAALNSHSKAISIVAHAAAHLKGGIDQFKDIMKIPALSGESVLRAACVRGNLKTFLLLLQLGASAGQCDNDGSTPLLECTSWGHRDAAYVLLRTKRVYIHAMRVDGVVSLHQVCWAADLNLIRDLVPKPKRMPGGQIMRRSKMGSRRGTPSTPLSPNSFKMW